MRLLATIADIGGFTVILLCVIAVVVTLIAGSR